MGLNISKKEIELCFERFLLDSEDDFFTDPIRYIDLKGEKDNLVKKVLEELKEILSRESINYNSKQYFDWDVPKENFVVRNAIAIHPHDNIIYHYIFNKLASDIEPSLSKARYSYKIRNIASKKILSRPVENWINFREDIKKYFEENDAYDYLVSTDIAGFFEYTHILDFKRQMYNLTKPKNKKIVELLNKFLKNFSPSDHSGIPQNYDPSSYLCSAFLDFFDKEMESSQLKHFRYVDDIKVACKTDSEAKKAIIKIIHCLRKQNLNLSTAKTEIWFRNDEKFKNFVKDFPAILREVDFAVKNKNRNKIEKNLPQLIQLAKDIIKDKKFDERLFRACIWRIVKCHYFKNTKRHRLDGIGKKCLTLIEKYPGKTDSFTRFLILNKNLKYVQSGLKNILLNSIYPWQIMKIWEVLIQSDKIMDDDIIKLAREKVRDGNYPEPAKNYAIVFLGKHGNYQDKECLADIFVQSNSFITKRCIIIALQEYSQKAQIYNQILSLPNDLILKSLVKYLKQLKNPAYIYENKNINSDLAFIS